MTLQLAKIIIGLSLFGVGCATDRVLPSLEITVQPVKFDQKTLTSKQLDRLAEELQRRPDWAVDVADMELVLKAQHLESTGNKSGASELWLELISNNKGEVAKYAFQQWLPLMESILGEKENTKAIANYFWNEGGQKTWLAKNYEFNSAESVEDYLRGRKANRDKQFKDSFKDLASNDPRLTRTAKLYCKNKDRHEWKSYLKSIKGLPRLYFNALVLDCSRQREMALRKFESLALKLSKRKKYLPLAVSSYRNIVDINRYLGEREKASNAFLALVKVMKDERLNYKSMGYKSEYEWQYEIADTILWASRYRAMVGDYLNARVLVQEGLMRLKKKEWEGLSLTRKQKDAVQELRAEAYHISANRISYEQKDLEAAHLQNRLGMELEDLSRTWVDRLNWYDGWYQFVGGKFSEAAESWEELLDRTESDRSKEKVLFWLARLYERSGDSDKFDEMLVRLFEEYPLGFYSLYGAKQFSWKHSSWLVQNEKVLRKDLSAWDVNIEPLVVDEKLNRLRVRAEIALKIGSEDLGVVTAKELYFAGRRLKLKYTESHMYITRILYMNNLFTLSMGHTTALAGAEPKLWHQFPEQALVYFPTPFSEEFEQQSKSPYFDKTFLMSIARQESAFRPDAKSWAGAVGLLQLMPKTAQKYSRQNLTEDTMISKLEDPSFNIKTATKYMNQLNSHYDGSLHQVVAAYNAGEFVVDRWSDARASENAMQWIENIPFSETNNYVKKVMRNWAVYKALYFNAS